MQLFYNRLKLYEVLYLKTKMTNLFNYAENKFFFVQTIFLSIKVIEKSV